MTGHERGDRHNDEEQREVPLGDQQHMRRDHPRVVTELLGEERLNDGTGKEVNADEEWKPIGQGLIVDRFPRKRTVVARFRRRRYDVARKRRFR